MSEHFNRESKPLALVVDDDPLIRMDMVDMLGELGFEVNEADSVASALTFLGLCGERVSLLLTDVQMPGTRNGMTLANHASYMWPHIRIVVVSGAVQPINGELPHTVEFLPKPVSPQALNAYVSRIPLDMPTEASAQQHH